MITIPFNIASVSYTSINNKLICIYGFIVYQHYAATSGRLPNISFLNNNIFDENIYESKALLFTFQSSWLVT